MKHQFLAAVAAATLSSGAAIAQRVPEPAYMCVPTAGAGDALNVPNVGAWCPTPEHYVIDKENRVLAQMRAREPSSVIASAPTTRPHG